MNKMTWMCLVFIITLALSRSKGFSGFLSSDPERDNSLFNDNEDSLQQDQRIFDYELEDILRFLAQDNGEPAENTEDSDSSDSSDSSDEEDYQQTRRDKGRGSFETIDEPEPTTDYGVGKQKNQAELLEEGEGNSEDFRNSHNGRGSFETFEEPETSTDPSIEKQQAQAGYLEGEAEDAHNSHNGRGPFETFEEPEGTL